MAQEVQNFENHTKRVPAFHFVVLPIFFLNIIWCIERVIHQHTFGTIVSLLVAIALLLLAFNARIFALTVQNRIIRLEMQLRLQQLLPQDLKPRISEFTLAQLVSLRFASDAELAQLARKVLDEKLNDRKAIKKLIRNWQPDYLRA
ncbi:MAG: DUF6526 family protein [Candidatus Acidiferrales bacterium]